MSDPNLLAGQVTQFLTPLLPYLIKGGLEAGKAAAGKLGEPTTEKGWEKGQSLWKLLSRHERVKQAAETAAGLPEDADAQAALRLQIRLVLESEAALAKTLEKAMADLVQATREDRLVTISGNVSNSIIVTGNKNRVKK